MDNNDSKIYRCYGSLLRKQRHWPPAARPEPVLSPASKLRQRPMWQPQVWHKACFL